MNKKLVTLFSALFLTTALVACGSNGGNDTPSKGDGDTTETPVAGEKKVLKLLETSNIPSLVPWAATDSVSFLTLGNVMEGLTVMGENGSIHPGVATKWDVSEDGLTYTFHLNKDAKWVTADGTEYAAITANDFVYSWKKLIDPTSGAQYNFMIATAGIKGANDALTLAEQLVTLDQANADLAALKVEDFTDGENGTAQEQFDKNKESLEGTIADVEKTLTSDLGFASVEDAQNGMDNLIDALGVKAVDEYTLQVELEVPTAYFLSLMAFPSFYPVNEAFVNEVTEDKFGTSVDKFLYNGAFVFKEWKHSERHYWEANPLYWDAENVALDGVDFRVVEGIDNNAAVGMYTNGDIMSVGLSGENVGKYGSRQDAIALGDASVFYLEVNNGKGTITPEKEMLMNTNARKAIDMAIDKAFITDNIFSNGSIPAYYMVPEDFAFGPEGTKYEGVDFRETAGKDGYSSFNKEEAAKLWAQARQETGITGKLELEIIIFSGDSAAQVGAAIKDDLETNLGDEDLSIVISVLPFSEKLQRSAAGDYHMVWSGWGPDYTDPMTFLDMWVSGNGQNKVGYNNAEYDQLVNDSKTGDLTTDPEARWEALLKAEELLIGEDQAIVPLYQKGSVGLRDKKILNLYPQAVGPDYIYKWVDLAE
ncbi:MAG TPA: peptide ABC transporter substrate-binding protein [Firmicutes bacterium]|nr:peptide ABC transporter substrate-binding protein [Bacillota bacterium]